MNKIQIIVNNQKVAEYYIPTDLTAAEFGTDAVTAAIAQHGTQDVCWDYAS